ncbi:hypothetical protein Tco_0476109 [Tanacetum coccineum]
MTSLSSGLDTCTPAWLFYVFTCSGIIVAIAVTTWIEEILEVESSALARKPFKKPDLKLNRLPQLLLEGPSLNDDVQVPSFNAEKDKQTTYYDDNEANSVSESDEEVVNEDETVNMQEFCQNIDKDVEWVRRSKGNLEVPTQMDVEEGYDLDDFDMDIDCDNDIETSRKRKKGLRALRRESKNKCDHFFVGKEFADKKQATTLVTSQVVATRRQLYVWKNDNGRVRAVCKGKCPVFTNLIRPNASGLIKALKEQLKKKYQVGTSICEVKRERAKTIMKFKRDFSEQYSSLRDYVLELQRTNKDTTMKIDLERDYNPSEITRHFKRIYVCIGALNRGFKEGLRDLLGLDGCFMKGQYPSQLLIAIRIDANHGIYPLAYAIVETENTSSWS